MELTRVQVESALVGRSRIWMELLSLPLTIDGTNSAMSDAIARAIRRLGGTTANPIDPDDDDLATVPVSVSTDRFLDLTYLHWLDWILGNWDQVSYTVDGRTEQFDDMFKAIDQALIRSTTRYDALYPPPTQPIGTARIGSASMTDDPTWRVPCPW